MRSTNEQLEKQYSESDGTMSRKYGGTGLGLSISRELKKDNLNNLLETLFPLFQADAFNRKNDVRLELEQIPDLVFDQREVRQMILNLVRNGYEAMPNGGTLTIRTINKKKEVISEIQDQGNGIEPCILEKLGDPFFYCKREWNRARIVCLL